MNADSGDTTANPESEGTEPEGSEVTDSEISEASDIAQPASPSSTSPPSELRSAWGQVSWPLTALVAVLLAAAVGAGFLINALSNNDDDRRDDEVSYSSDTAVPPLDDNKDDYDKDAYKNGYRDYWDEDEFCRYHRSGRNGRGGVFCDYGQYDLDRFDDRFGDRFNGRLNGFGRNNLGNLLPLLRDWLGEYGPNFDGDFLDDDSSGSFILPRFGGQLDEGTLREFLQENGLDAQLQLLDELLEEDGVDELLEGSDDLITSFIEELLESVFDDLFTDDTDDDTEDTEVEEPETEGAES